MVGLGCNLVCGFVGFDGLCFCFGVVLDLWGLVVAICSVPVVCVLLILLFGGVVLLVCCAVFVGVLCC